MYCPIRPNISYNMHAGGDVEVLVFFRLITHLLRSCSAAGARESRPCDVPCDQAHRSTGTCVRMREEVEDRRLSTTHDHWCFVHTSVCSSNASLMNHTQHSRPLVCMYVCLCSGYCIGMFFFCSISTSFWCLLLPSLPSVTMQVSSPTLPHSYGHVAREALRRAGLGDYPSW